MGDSWIAEPFGDGLTRHVLARGRVRAIVLSGYDDRMAFAKLMFAPYRNSTDEIEITHSYFGGGPRTEAESIAEAKAAAIEWAREIGALVAFAGGLTVGAALALPEVQRGEAVVEYFVRVEPFGGTDRTQVRIDHDGVLVGRWPDNDGEDREWDRAYVTPRDMPLPCRLVPLASCDADPATRGDL